MPKSVWIIASVLSALVLLGYAGLTLRQQDQDMRELRAQLEQGVNRMEALTNQLRLAQTQIEELQQRNEAAGQAQKNLESEMRQAIASKEVTISQLQGKLTVNILDRILFDSGEAVLKPEGEEVLKQIASVLAQFPQRQIHVIGHTDNVPIRAGSRNRYASNWELSTARATAAVRFLSEVAGVDPRRLGAVGYGEFHPIADNATAEGKAKNRRIALVVLSEELAGSDAVPHARVLAAASGGAAATTNTVAQTNVVVQTNTAAPAPSAAAVPLPAPGTNVAPHDNGRVDNPAFATPPAIATNTPLPNPGTAQEE